MATGAELSPWRGTLGAEWIKFWSVRSTWWSVASAVGLMAFSSMVLGIDFSGDVEAGESADGPTMGRGEPATESVVVAQFGIVALAMLLMTAEFATGAMRVTLTADPSRGRVLLAKTAVVGAVSAVLGVVLAVVGVAAGAVALGDQGTGGAGSLLRDGLAITVYVALTAVITVGVGAWVRSTAGTMGVVLSVMVALPLIMTTTGSEYLPGRAGMILLSGEDDVLHPVVAGVVLAAWAVIAQVVGWVALRRRDV
ncbi:ABC transporter permease [Streptomyces avicenniae]|uniref:ABC transporter permease n=1 Tax=Streptomyces avicenniae TaxID=500153 RepID=UPI00069A365C|nr:ABC transporter permease [Streptomyces avicenniae]